MKRYEAEVDAMGRVTIPPSIRAVLHIAGGDRIVFVSNHGQVRLAPVRGFIARTAGLFRGGRSASIEEQKEAFARAVVEDVADELRGE